MVPSLLLALLAVPPSGAAGLDPSALAGTCEAGDVDSCLTLARARTGVGLPVDLVSAREAYTKACSRGSSDGCAGAEGITRLLGRHVDLHLLTSVPRIWLLTGPEWVKAGGTVSPPGDAVVAAVQQRLNFARNCYAMAVEDQRSLEGMLDLGLVVSEGRAAELLMHQSSLPDVDAATCIAQAMGKARLPENTPSGELFMRLRAEPAPAAYRNPPVVQDHLADGAQASIGEPVVDLPADSPDRRRLEIAVTASVRKAMGGAPCVLDDVKAGRWEPVTLELRLPLEPDGSVAGVSVVADNDARQELAACVQSRLAGLQVGETGIDARVQASVDMNVSPIWTATWVP